MNKIAVLDFGSQYAHLIATRIRRLGIYSEILDPATPATELKDYAGIILSGGPSAVYEEGSPTVDKAIFDLGKPILGICYGHQLITHLLGGKVEAGKGHGSEFGKNEITVRIPAGILSGFAEGEKSQVWMSHGDRVTRLPEGFEILAGSSDDEYSAVGNLARNFYGVQFHPEVVHTVKGTEILSNFLRLTGVARDWDLGSFIEKTCEDLRAHAGKRNVFMLVSGGVDSTVAYTLLVRALGQERVYGLFVDTGFMRAGEREDVERALHDEGITGFHTIDAGAEFAAALKGVLEPEKKREIIGNTFLEIQKKVSSDLKLNPDEWMLGQGTIYPDTIESGGTRHADKIKTHHNRVPEVEELIKKGLVIEPLKDLYKDEVRAVGEKLGLPKNLVWRHPFPGPGLAVRILCADKEDWAPDNASLEQKIAEFLKEKGSNLIARTLPIKSVGVQGDYRTYRHPLVLISPAGLASARPTDWDELATLAPQITNRFEELNRVLYLLNPVQITSLSVTPGDLNPARTARLRQADKLARIWLKEIGAEREVWQMPTVLIPVAVNAPADAAAESIVLRPIVSEEAMTASFARLPMEKVAELAARIMEDPTISAVFYDITNKPPATIEWE
ncbi:MAG: glutamine-hydrolyzing GMP synthase [Candidatus Gracilibacteria bacterium]|jgi:GMP synthase (glutamine-hydrolysing)